MTAVPNPFGAGEKRWLEGHPRVTQDSTSTCTAITDRENRSTGLPAWHLTFAPYTEGGKPVDVTFARDDTILTMFMQEHAIVVPGNLKPLHVNWRVVWRKVGYINVCREITIREEPMPVTTPTAPTPAPAAAAPSELDERFPRDANNQPVEDKPAAATPAWGDDNKRRGRFFQYYEDLCASHAVPKDEREPIRKRVLKTKYGVDSLKGFNQPEADLLKALKAEIEPLYPLEMAGTNGKTQQPAAPEKALETPPANATQAPATPIPETKENATVTISDGKTTPSSSGMSEAGFSMNFYWCDADGAETQFTMREATWQAGLANVEKFKAGLRALGYMPKAEWHRKYAPNGQMYKDDAPATPPPAETNSGIASCMMIKVGKAFSNQKPQLEFECDGFEKPLRFTNENLGILAGKLSAIRKSDGNAYNATDMVDGRKFAGNCRVKWVKETGKDGKTYYNVVEVLPAA